jgi:uncharacterized membrane protein YgdD (TMEM256/DUF423 family)
MKKHDIILLLGASFCGLSVAIGAFAAHGLKAILDSQALGWIQTGAHYQMSHGLALIVLGFAMKQWPNWRGLLPASCGFSVGILFFSGSLYLMAATQIKALGIITPIGGLAFLIGWSCLVYAATRNTDKPIENTHVR